MPFTAEDLRYVENCSIREKFASLKAVIPIGCANPLYSKNADRSVWHASLGCSFQSIRITWTRQRKSNLHPSCAGECDGQTVHRRVRLFDVTVDWYMPVHRGYCESRFARIPTEKRQSYPSWQQILIIAFILYVSDGFMMYFINSILM